MMLLLALSVGCLSLGGAAVTHRVLHRRASVTSSAQRNDHNVTTPAAAAVYDETTLHTSSDISHCASCPSTV